MSRQMELVRAVALKADALYETAEQFGSRMARQITDQRGQAQVKGLEAIANSALKASDVLDYVKTRTARHKEWSDNNLGRELLAFLTDGTGLTDDTGTPYSLYKQRDAINAGLHLEPAERQQVTVMLYREFIRQVAAQYLFALQERSSEKGGEGESLRSR